MVIFVVDPGDYSQEDKEIMAGHNKWSKIKRKKGATDAKRSKAFSRIVKEIMVSVKEGGSNDPDFNPRLRVAINNAKGINMPKDNIERAIKKADETDSASISEPTYEGYGPGGVAIFVECATDNLNRTVADVRAAFNKNDGSLATAGSVDYLFDRKGIFVFAEEDWNEEELALELIDAGAEDLELDEGEFTVTTALEDFGAMQKKLEELNVDVTSAELQRIPKVSTEIEPSIATSALKLIEKIEDVDDVQAVYHNIEMTDEIAALV